MGASESDSAPPANTTSACPRAIWSAASVAAWIEVAQARETVCASTLLGSCVRSATSRATSETRGDGITCPKTTASYSSGGIPLRATSSFTRIAPRSTAERSTKSPPAFTKGVRRPATMAARRPRPGAPLVDTVASPLITESRVLQVYLDGATQSVKLATGSLGSP